jgi:hypothetical protein
MDATFVKIRVSTSILEAVINSTQKRMLKNCITLLLANAGGHATKLSGYDR